MAATVLMMGWCSRQHAPPGCQAPRRPVASTTIAGHQRPAHAAPTHMQHPPTRVVDAHEVGVHEAEHHLTAALLQEARLPPTVLCRVVLHLLLLPLLLLLLAVWLLLLLVLLLAGPAASPAATAAAAPPAPVLLLPPPAAPLLAVALIALLLLDDLVQAHAQARRLSHRCCCPHESEAV